MEPEYKDPSKEMLGNGRSMADMMRRGPGGIQGAIIAKSNNGGTPVNFNPHDRAALAVTIVDPDGRGSQNLRLSDITKEKMSAAISAVNNRIDDTGDIETIRERAALVFEELAKQSRTVVKKSAGNEQPPPQMFQPQTQVAPAAPMYEQAPQPSPRIDSEYSPMAAFGLKRSARAATGSGAQRPAIDEMAAPPKKLVYFEKEGIGTIHGFFHDVIVRLYEDDGEDGQKGFIVLIYDLRFPQNAARWFPPANDPYGRPWALKMDDDSRLYLVHTTGFQYVYDAREYCVLLVEQALTPPADEG